MPNWVTGTYAIKGAKNNVLNFLNEGIKKSGYEPKNDVAAALEFLKENAVTLVTDYDYTEDGAGAIIDNPAVIAKRKQLTLDTFRPMPETFLKYDTTNNEENLKEVAQEQKKKYGCVGWYDWGIKYRGTKWNAEIDELALSESGNTAMLTFDCTTAWSIPEGWLRWVKDTFDVKVFICASEESDAFNFYGELGDDEFELSEEDAPKKKDYDSDDAYDVAYYDWLIEARDKMERDFLDYVEDYKI